ncbi:hypothetical protein HYV30_00560 [Candidatus Kaiserbacteria bacterium]|nr:hypothetical protein [Candidatus Kaiserbacteria bacterium]
MEMRDIATWPTKKIRKWLRARDTTLLSKYTDEYLEYFNHLFSRAGDTNGFTYLYTILRVEGITDGHWDAFVEAEDTAMDFSKMMRKMGKGQEKRALRMALFLYCHSTEMSAPYEVITNLLRCCMDQPYKMYPFDHLVTVERKTEGLFPRRHLPYPRQKISYIKELAAASGEERIGEIIDGFFNNEVRNAFYHSDYTISDEEFRIIEGADIGARSISLEKLSDMLSRCFAFYSAFFITYKQVRKGLASGSKYRIMRDLEVLEFLSTPDEGLTGFKMHFPNGNYAMFERKKYEGTMGLNIMVEEEGVVMNVGDLAAYEAATEWKVDGKPFDQGGTRYNRIGYWFPILFRRNSSALQHKAQQATLDKEVQGCLFYIYATGHRAIEFVIKSNTPLFNGEKYSRSFWSKNKYLEIEKIENQSGSAALYDGTYYLGDNKPETIRAALDEIDVLMNKFKKKDDGVELRLKYQMYSKASSARPKRNADGSFSVTISFDDPRSTMVASNLSMFPRTDWRIREEWVS